MNDPVAQRVKDLRGVVAFGGPLVKMEELEWLLDRHDWAVEALKTQQKLNNDAYENGRKLGYELGRADGYDAALRETDQI